MFEEISVTAEEETVSWRSRLSDVMKSEITIIFDAAQPKSMKNATLGVLFNFCPEKNFELNLDSCSASNLSEILQ